MNRIPVYRPDLGEDTLKHLAHCFEIGWLGIGAITKEFEEHISKFLELEDRYVIATNTATSALHLALRIAGIRPGDEVITPSFNCVADQQAIRMSGAEVVMCDIKEGNLGIDSKKAEELITDKTKAIVPLHYAGIPCDQNEIYNLAKKHDLRVIEDCCHAFGTSIDGKKIGSYGDMAFFSFDAIKTITSVDGGCLIVRSKEELEKSQQLRLLGMNKDTLERYKHKHSWNYDVISEGYRYHLNNVLASIGISQIKKVNEIISSRQRVCKMYDNAFHDISGLKITETDYSTISPFIYVIRVLEGKRDFLIQHLDENNIDTHIHWTPVHEFSYFANAKHGDLSVTEKTAKQILTIPLYSNMKQEYIERVIDGVTSYFTK